MSARDSHVVVRTKDNDLRKVSAVEGTTFAMEPRAYVVHLPQGARLAWAHIRGSLICVGEDGQAYSAADRCNAVTEMRARMKDLTVENEEVMEWIVASRSTAEMCALLKSDAEMRTAIQIAQDELGSNTEAPGTLPGSPF